MARRGGGFLNKLILLVLVVTAAVVGIAYFLSPSSPFRTTTTTIAPSPVTIGQIQKLYRLQTAQITGNKIVQGETKSVLPFSSAKLTYQVTVTMTAGVDLSLLKDNDIKADGDTLTIALPAPQLLNEETDFVPVAESKGILAGPSERKELPKEIVDQGRKEVRQAILDQGKLMKDARTNAEDEVRNLIFQIAPQYKRVIFLDPNLTPSPSSKPNPTGPPR